MTPQLGVSIARTALRAVVADQGAIRWAAESPYAGAAELSEVLARLTAESGVAVRAVRIVLERDVVQVRTVTPAPPLRPGGLRRYVALEAPRLFRENGDRLVTDVTRVVLDAHTAALWAAAAPQSLVEAALAGCAQAGLEPEALGVAADVLPEALAARPASGEVAIPNGTTTEVLSLCAAGVWRSRYVAGTQADACTWAPPLAGLGPQAPRFAAAFAATLRQPRLELYPETVFAERSRVAGRRRARLAALGAGLWLVAGVLYGSRMMATAASVSRELAASAPAADSALALQRDVAAAAATIETITAAQRARSQHLTLLAALTRAIGDSTYLAALRLERDSTVRLVGDAPAATRVLANIEGVPGLRDARLEGPVTRATVPGHGTLDRFAIAAQRMGVP